VVVREDVIQALHGVEDPELGMDIVELGLMYDVEVDGPSVKVLYSLTSMGCPAGAMIAEASSTRLGASRASRPSRRSSRSTLRGRPIACRTTRSSSSASAECFADRDPLKGGFRSQESDTRAVLARLG
jgi:metal-sulfur cluster biosynthetic enzyme